jgi:dihydrofolate reductase
MPRLVARNISVSLDGFMAGPDQSLEHPLGVGAERLHEWVFATRTGRAMISDDGTGDTGPDDDVLAHADDGVGATIMGRNMFGPIRGDWGDGAWSGWWGEDPPYHHPVFVLTHHPRESIPMSGGTVFHFVTDGIEAALERAYDAAGGLDVRVGGGAATLRAYLRAGLLDELTLAVVPVLLGRGERVLDGPYETYAAQPGSVAHMRVVRRTDNGA